MFNNRVARQVGTVIHRMIAAAVRDDLHPSQVDELARRCWTERPLGGTTAWQTRTRAAVMASVYLRKLRPHGWQLLGDEVRLDSSVADLVYGLFDDDELVAVFIDEIKTGRRPFDSADLADQVARLSADGRARWGDRFCGVRVAALAQPGRSGFRVAAGRSLLPAEGPALQVEVPTR